MLKGRRRRKAFGVLLLCMLTALAGCGKAGDNTATGPVKLFGGSEETEKEETRESVPESTAESVPESGETSEKEQTGEKEPVLSADFGNVGNNPNNLYQTKGCPAFDSEHIYWCEDGNVIQARLDGSEASVIGKGGVFLNVYDGWLYAGDEKSSYVGIHRINLDTREEETIMEYAPIGSNPYPKFTSMLAAEGCLIYSLSNGSRTEISTLNLEDMMSLYQYSSAEGDEDVRLSVCGSSVYAFLKDLDTFDGRSVWKLDINEETLSPMTEGFRQLVTGERFRLGIYGTTIFNPDGIYRYSEKNDNYLDARYEEIDPEEKTWFSYTKLCEGTEARVAYKAPRFLLGNTMFLLEAKEKEADIYKYDNFDFTSGQYVTTAGVDAVFWNGEQAIYGVHENYLYLVEVKEEGTEIIRISPEGTVERYAVVLKQ